jgi:hypothetical protein
MKCTKLEFAGPEWIDAARAVLEELVADNGEEGTVFSVCEVFTGAPASVARDGAAAWHFRIDGNSVRVGAGEVADVDVLIRADYQAALPGARLVYTPEVLARRAAEPQQGGSAVVTGDMSRAPPYLIELHNRLAVLTA